jgi:HSP20 family protein
MADTKAHPTETKRETSQSVATRERDRGAMRRWESDYGRTASPFEFFDRVYDEMDRWLGRVTRDVGFPQPSWLSPRSWGAGGREGLWAPRIEAFQKGDRFIVRAELPGLKKDDVEVELTDDALTIHGERREERQEEREGYFHSEREYGQFHRTVRLPEGVIGETANASFRDGVLEVSMQAAPSEANRGRKLEIKDTSHDAKR